MNEVIEALYAEKMATTSDGKTIPLEESVIPRHHGELLYRLVREFNAGTHTIEVGMGFGLSTLFICQAHQENGGGHHVAIDPYQEEVWKNTGVESMKRAELAAYYTLHEERSFTALPTLFQKDCAFDMAFIDGNHRFEHAFLDFFYLDRMLNVGGYIVFHDTMMPPIRKLIAFLKRNHHEFYDMAHHYSPPGLSRKNQLLRFPKKLRENHYDLTMSLTLRNMDIPEYAVFRKKAHLTEGEYDFRWKDYASF